MLNAFGSGSLIATDSGANPTPIDFNVLQEASVDFSASTKELMGSNQFPLAVGRGGAKIGVKAKYGVFDGRLMNTLFFGGTLATGQTNLLEDVSAPIPTTPFTITAANTTGFVDQGVVDNATGIRMVRVASAPATGQYTVTAGGVYTFAAADTGKTVRYSYTYTIAGSGQTISISNPLLGVSSFFKAVLSSQYNAQKNTLILNANMANKMSYGTKLEDFGLPEFEFSSFADSANNIGTWSLAEAS